MPCHFLRLLRTCCVMLLSTTAVAGQLQLAPEMLQTTDMLWLNVQLEPAQDVLDALDAHISLPFRLDRRCGGVHQVAELSLRLRPLSQDYVLTLADASEQSFRLRAEAFAAFRRLALPRPLPCGELPVFLRVRLELAGLPAPLRLPALLSSDWQLDSGWVLAVVREVHD